MKEEKFKANELFMDAVNYVKDKKFAKNNSEIVKRAKYGQNTITRIKKHNCVVDEDTIRKFVDAFPVININYLRGKSDIISVTEEEEKVEVNEAPVPFAFWADNLIGIISAQIKQNEELNKKLQESIDEINNLRSQLQSLLETLKK